MNDKKEERMIRSEGRAGTMTGIVSFGAYIPYHRLERKSVADTYGDRLAKGEKAVANYDEDSVSMGVAAAIDCLAGQSVQRLDFLCFSTTTAPYLEKQSASILAAALDLRQNVRVMDTTGSIRASASGMLAALDAIKAGAQTALAVAADCRLGAPKGPFEQWFGDGGAAFLLGAGEHVIAKVISTFSTTIEQTGMWRERGDEFVRSWEDRFVQTVYLDTVSASVRGLLEQTGYNPQDFSKVVIAGPNPRVQQAACKKLGFAQEQWQDTLFDHVGLTGTAHAPMMLVAALEASVPGDLLLYASFGEGSDAIVWEVTDAITRLPRRRGIGGHLELKNNGLSYSSYLTWRGILSVEQARRPETVRPSVTAMHRNMQQNLGLYGTKCLACGTPQFPKQRVCAVCQAKDQMEAYRFFGKPAKVATYTIDHLAASPAPPMIVAVIDFDGGGRIMCEVTDCKPDEVHIGMEVEMTFRHLYEAGGIHNYFWKAKPKR